MITCHCIQSEWLGGAGAEAGFSVLTLGTVLYIRSQSAISVLVLTSTAGALNNLESNGQNSKIRVPKIVRSEALTQEPAVTGGFFAEKAP
jgi:hypothetical protein